MGSPLAVLLVEDDPDPVDRFLLLLGRACRRFAPPVETVVHVATNVTDGSALAVKGIYPLVVVDMCLQDLRAGAGGRLDTYAGLRIIACARQHSRRTVIAAYTSYGAEVFGERADAVIDGFLDKTADGDELVARLSRLVSLALDRQRAAADSDVPS
jgi:hypothetical protein